MHKSSNVAPLQKEKGNKIYVDKGHVNRITPDSRFRCLPTPPCIHTHLSDNHFRLRNFSNKIYEQIKYSVPISKSCQGCAATVLRDIEERILSLRATLELPELFAPSCSLLLAIFH